METDRCGSGAGHLDAGEVAARAAQGDAAGERLRDAQRVSVCLGAAIADWQWQATSGLVHVSDDMQAIVGVDVGNVPCRHSGFLTAVHAEDRAAVRRGLRLAAARGKPCAVDLRIVGADGVTRLVQLRAQSLHRGRTRPLELVGTVQALSDCKRAEQARVELSEASRRLGAHMEAVREEERKRIALEVHDELGQLLTALKIDVGLMRMRLGDVDETGARLAAMRDRVERAMSAVRNIANHLRPAALSFGLVSALEWLTENIERHTGIHCAFVRIGPEPTLPDSQATAIFRIVQESLTNVVRHAAATLVEVAISCAEGRLEIRVSDDGCGFDPDARRTRDAYGLVGMLERARLIGATLAIESGPGKGTVVSIGMPAALAVVHSREQARGTGHRVRIA